MKKASYNIRRKFNIEDCSREVEIREPFEKEGKIHAGLITSTFRLSLSEPMIVRITPIIIMTMA
jgi:hypothetical protein